MGRFTPGANAADASTFGVAAEVDDEFFALVYADEELLRHEFDDLIAAAWSGPPPGEGRDLGDEEPADSPPLDNSWEGVRRRLRTVGGGGSRRRSRTRSPPSDNGLRPR